MRDASPSNSSAATGRWRGPVALIVSAAIVGIAVMSLIGSPERKATPSEWACETADGRLFNSESQIGAPWLLVVDAAEVGLPVTEAAERLRRDIPGRVSLARLSDRSGPVDADATPFDLQLVAGPAALRGIRGRLLEGAEGVWSDAQSLIVTFDHTGRVTAVREGTLAGAEATLEDLAGVVAMSRRPLLHAVLNGSSAVLLLLAYAFVRLRRIKLHLTFMIVATLVMGVFLVSYLDYHSVAGSVSYRGTGWLRAVYLGILLSHTLLAALNVPLVLTVYFHAARRRFDSHRRLARWTLPLWLYVSVTGVVIYLMLYVWSPTGGAG